MAVSLEIGCAPAVAISVEHRERRVVGLGEVVGLFFEKGLKEGGNMDLATKIFLLLVKQYRAFKLLGGLTA